MPVTARIFKNGKNRAVRIPAVFQLTTDEVYIRQNEEGEIILTPKHKSWDDFWDLPPAECALEREAGDNKPAPFDDWTE